MKNVLRVGAAYVAVAALCLGGYAVGAKTETALQGGGAAQAAIAVYQPTTVRVATYNALGYSHTDLRGGNERWRLGGVARTDLMYRIFLHRGIGLAAVQEFQGPQRREWRRVAGRTYGLYCPATPHSPYSRQNCVVWHKSDWVVSAYGTVTVPYFHWRRVHMPVAVFLNRHTHGVLLLDSVHNPTTSRVHGHEYPERLRGWAIEATHALGYKIPAVLAGDRNARRAEYAPRRPPTYRVAGQRGIDWIVGRYLTFTGYTSSRSGLVRRATDHPIVYVNVRF